MVQESAVTDEPRPAQLNLDALRSRARWAQIALVVVALVDVVAIASGAAEYRLLGTDYTIEEADANDQRQAAVGIIQFLLLIVTAILFIRWFKRAYENVDALGRERRYGTGWAIGAWFVPILNLWRPKQIANDIWRASNERADDEGVSPLLTLWWAAFLVANWIYYAAARVSFSAETVDEFRRAAVVYMVADGLDLVAAVLAIWVVRTITARQAADRAALSGLAQPEPAPDYRTSS
jgi:hypothetical protein